MAAVTAYLVRVGVLENGARLRRQLPILHGLGQSLSDGCSGFGRHERVAVGAEISADRRLFGRL